MARKKQDIALQREIETQEEWEEVMAMEGLWVVDVYQEWCGPCQALVGNFRRIKNELGDSLLNFAVAKTDTIDALEIYRGKSEPTFLFFAGGILVAAIHGANAPKVQRTITEQLAQEHKVLEGTAERKEVKDTVITRRQEKEQEKLEEEEAAREAEENKGVTVAIIKPDAVAAGKVDDILAEMKENNIEIIDQVERELTEDEARYIYKELEDEDYFEELISFMTSGSSHVLVLTRGETGENIIKDWREMIGPTNVEQAQEEAPESFRAKYGEKGYLNALHGSSSEEQAASELGFFFPGLVLPTYLKKKENIQRTLALIRPEAFNASKDEILEKIKDAGFSIALYKEVQLTRDQAADFYKEHAGNAYYDELVSLMSSGPLLALGLARDEAISAWREMLGPNNVDEAQEQNPDLLRAKFVGDSGINQFHGSDSEEAAKKEIDFFFPMEETVAVIKPGAMGTKDAIIEKIHEAGFRIAAHKETMITKEIADILYPDHQEKDYYEDLVNSLTSGPTYFMVLSKENAVEGWRKAIGDVDPDSAKANNPASLRAQFGEDILNNAVHGSSTKERAREEMRAVFGDLEFNEDGTVKGEQPDLDEATVERTDETTDDTTLDQTTIEQDTTQAPSADVTADNSQVDQTNADTTQMDETTMEPTIDETTEGETTMETTTADDTVAGEVTQAQEGAADQTVDPTTADVTTADTTTYESTTPDETTTEITPSAELTTVNESQAAEGQSEEQGQETQASEPPREATPQQEESAPQQQQGEQSPAEESAGQQQEESKPEEITDQQKADEPKKVEGEGDAGGDAAPAQEESKPADEQAAQPAAE